ncbi:MAG: hypothetical protein IPI69_15375, partial [Bacteroidales bacterium]|nr:hypothetical protein [Bacteroidales bacterium]
HTTDRQGVPYGMTDVLTQKWWSTNSANRVSLYARNPLILQASFPTTFLDYPTVCFMISEIEGWDADWFEEGIVASFEMWSTIEMQEILMEGGAYAPK